MSNKNRNTNKIIRYIVKMPEEDNVVSYNTELDNVTNFKSHSLAIHTACRYNGTIYAEYETDENSPDRFKRIKDYGKNKI